MKHFSEFEYGILTKAIFVKKKDIYYANIPVAFDIETSSLAVSDEKFAFMYEWTFGLIDNQHIYYGRTKDEFLKFLHIFELYLRLGKNRRLIVYVHNLSFEFQFIRKWFKWENIFSVDLRKPIKALTISGIEFRDSYILSGLSLALTAKNLVQHNVHKLEGDLDYKLIRTPETPLTDEEKAYCNNDVEILIDYIDEQITTYGYITKIPLTNTGRVRNFVRKKCYKNYMSYRSIMNECTITSSEEYNMLKAAYQGGYTHANAAYTGKVLSNVHSVDFTSSYPTTMISEEYPMSTGEKIEIQSISHFKYLCKKYCVLTEIALKDVCLRDGVFDCYLSESKCSGVNMRLNNGRIYSADTVYTTITDIDFFVIEKCYTYSALSFGRTYIYKKRYLPKEIVESVLELYQKKTELKNVEGYEQEYLLSKGMLNAMYGATVTDIVKDEIKYNDEECWYTEAVNVEESLTNYNQSKGRFLFYPWGVWITAYARANLWSGIYSLGIDYIYSDTDSLKFLNYDKHKDYLDAYNETIIEKCTKVCDYYKINPEKLAPMTNNGIKKPIGVWDYEGCYSYFKTLGAKRYFCFTYPNKFLLTVAGLPKQAGTKFLQKQAAACYLKDQSKTVLEYIFENFCNEMYVPAQATGKLTHLYIDEYKQFEVTDYLGNTSLVSADSSVHLLDCEFTLSLSKQYIRFLEDYVNNIQNVKL